MKYLIGIFSTREGLAGFNLLQCKAGSFRWHLCIFALRVGRLWSRQPDVCGVDRSGHHPLVCALVTLGVQLEQRAHRFQIHSSEHLKQKKRH
ncbi:unnamed protein product, partial [Nesidiocoris tenuis]